MLYKATSPEQTIQRIRSILNELGITVVETEWIMEHNIFSCRVEVPGARLGTNGKGTTPVYALASAYAEFMERLQTHMLFIHDEFEEDIIEQYNFRYDPRERHLSFEDLIELPDDFKKSYMFADNYSTYDYWKDMYISKKDIHSESKFVYLPFQELLEGKSIYLPSNIVFMMNGSNGMCAGNSPEEAKIQGISELFERYVQKKIFFNNIVIPTVASDYLETTFPIEYKMIQAIQMSHSYEIKVKDCTFEGSYPVLAVVVQDIENRRFAVCFGAEPDLRIALQRCLTEVFQGDPFLSVKANSLRVRLMSDLTIKDYNYQLKNSSGSWGYSILDSSDFSSPPVTEFYSWDEKMEFLINQLKAMNICSIYVRDCSFTGFNTYQIVIPGLSEAFVYQDDRKVVERLSLNFILASLQTASEIEKTCFIHDLKIRLNHEFAEVLGVIKRWRISIDGNIYKSLTWHFIMFALNWTMYKTKDSLVYLRQHIEQCHDTKDIHIFSNLYDYCCLILQGISKEQAFCTIVQFCDELEMEWICRLCDDPILYICKSDEDDEVYNNRVRVYTLLKQYQNEYV